MAKRLADSGAHIAALQTQQDSIKAKLDALSKLDEYRDFQELDWQSLAAEIARLQAEKHQLEAASDILKALGIRLGEPIATRQATEKQPAEHRDKPSKTEQKLADAQSLQELTRALLHDPAQGSLADRFERLDAMRAEALGEHQLTVESCDNRERELRDWLQTRIDAEVNSPCAMAFGTSPNAYACASWTPSARCCRWGAIKTSHSTRRASPGSPPGLSCLRHRKRNQLPRLSSGSDGLVLFGAGYGLEALARAEWLTRCRIHFWGDIDTHGFAILDQLRAHWPDAASFLMDRDTLLQFRTQWVEEETPTPRDLARLTPEEQALYDDLRDNRLGTRVRLEQERIGFNWVERSLATLA